MIISIQINEGDMKVSTIIIVPRVSTAKLKCLEPIRFATNYYPHYHKSRPPTTPGYKVGIKTVTTLPSGLTGDLNYIITTQQQQPTCGQRALAILLLQLLLPIKFQLKTFQPHLSRSRSSSVHGRVLWQAQSHSHRDGTVEGWKLFGYMATLNRNAKSIVVVGCWPRGLN